MRGKIACSAQRLSVLDPAMVQSVVNGQAYQVGQQYRAENRVRIVEADERQISSVVIGNSGVYQVTIQLKDGALTTKCACPLNSEQPLCRHSVAALLEYHRWTQSKTARQPVRALGREPAPGPAQPMTSPSALDIKLSDIMLFVEWLQLGVRALEQHEPLPAAPATGSEAHAWAQAIHALDQTRRQCEERNVALEAEVRGHQAHLARITQQLQTSMDEAKAAQAACDTLRRELAEQASRHAKASEAIKTLEGFEGQVKRLSSEMIKNLSQLEGLTTSLVETKTTLNTALKQA